MSSFNGVDFTDFTGVTKLRESSRWHCNLCKCTIHSDSKIISHCKTGSHKAHVSGLKAEDKSRYTLLSRYNSVSEIKRRASQLFETWQNHILAELLRYLAADQARSSHCHLQEAGRLLEMYEPMERLSLLELAVWKACCISRAGEVRVDPNDVKTVDMAIRFAKKQKLSWKDYTAVMRQSNAIEIIIRNVIPFVGNA